MAFEGKNDYSARLNNPELRTAEESQGIQEEGFQDNTGTFPSPDYQDRTSVDMSATGDETLSIRALSSDSRIELPYREPKPSVYPYNQTWKSLSGHSIELDDTAGNERIMIRHNTGTGIELTEDGDLTIASKNHTIRIVAGDEKVIIEGNAHMVYKGDLDIDVAGDMNINVSGDMTTDVKGDKIDHVRGDTIQAYDGTLKTYVQGTEDHSTQGLYRLSSETGISTYTVDYISKSSTFTQSSANMNIDANEYAVHSPYMYLYGKHGAIGGKDIDLNVDTITAETTISAGKTISAVVSMKAPTFHGDLKGKSDDACKADKATGADTAGALGSAGVAGTPEHTTDVDPIIEYPIVTKFGTDGTSDDTYGSNFEYVCNLIPIESNNELTKVDEYLGVNKYIEATNGMIKHKPTAGEVINLLEKYPDNELLNEALKSDGLI